MRTHYGTLNYTRSTRDELAQTRRERDAIRAAEHIERQRTREWDAETKRRLREYEVIFREVFA